MVISTKKPLFKIGDKVCKKEGKSELRGEVVGTYSTAQTPFGYVVSSAFELNTVMCWPEIAVEIWKPSVFEQSAIDLLDSHRSLAKMK